MRVGECDELLVLTMSAMENSRDIQVTASYCLSVCPVSICVHLYAFVPAFVCLCVCFTARLSFCLSHCMCVQVFFCMYV